MILINNTQNQLSPKSFDLIPSLLHSQKEYHNRQKNNVAITALLINILIYSANK